jgi:DNA-binding CsgD family transcriptional regulator
MAPGLSVKEAAKMLGIGENTAKTHLQHIHSKTGTSKQTELVRLFMSSTPPVHAGQQPAGRRQGKYRL